MDRRSITLTSSKHTSQPNVLMLKIIFCSFVTTLFRHHYLTHLYCEFFVRFIQALHALNMTACFKSCNAHTVCVYSIHYKVYTTYTVYNGHSTYHTIPDKITLLIVLLCFITMHFLLPYTWIRTWLGYEL